MELGSFHADTSSTWFHFFSSTNEMKESLSLAPLYCLNTPFLTLEHAFINGNSLHFWHVSLEDGGERSDHEPPRQPRAGGDVHLAHAYLEVLGPAGELLPDGLQSATGGAPRGHAGMEIWMQCGKTRILLICWWKWGNTYNSTIHSPSRMSLQLSSVIVVNLDSTGEFTVRAITRNITSLVILCPDVFQIWRYTQASWSQCWFYRISACSVRSALA